ncbi:MAG: hypothetical protein VW169_16135, partial [Rhodospirillaceae bacterium]
MSAPRFFGKLQALMYAMNRFAANEMYQLFSFRQVPGQADVKKSALKVDTAAVFFPIAVASRVRAGSLFGFVRVVGPSEIACPNYDG